MAQVRCGVNELASEQFDGMSLSTIRAQYSQLLNIPEGCTVLLNGEPAEDMAYNLGPEDEVEFVKQSGTKG